MHPVIRNSDSTIVALVSSAAEVTPVTEHVISIDGQTFGADGGFSVLEVSLGPEALGQRYEAGQLVAVPDQTPPSPAIDIDALRRDCLRAVNDRYSRVMDQLKAGYPIDEILSWTEQAADAKALLDDPNAPAPLVRQIANVRGIDTLELAERISQNTHAFTAFSGAAIGNRQRLEAIIRAAESPEALLALNLDEGWPMLGT